LTFFSTSFLILFGNRQLELIIGGKVNYLEMSFGLLEVGIGLAAAIFLFRALSDKKSSSAGRGLCDAVNQFTA
jgi:hypothetical protein